MGLGYYLFSSTLDDRKQELTAVQQERQRVEAQTAELRQYELLAAERARTEEVVQTVYAGRTLVADILDSISLVVPETVWFQSLNLSTAEPAAGNWRGQIGRSGGSVDRRATYTFEEAALSSACNSSGHLWASTWLTPALRTIMARPGASP